MHGKRVRWRERVALFSVAVVCFCMTASGARTDDEGPDPATIIRAQADPLLAASIDARCSGYTRYADGSPFPDVSVYSVHWYGIDSTESRSDGYYTLSLPWESDYIIFADEPGWQFSSSVQLKSWELYEGARYTWNPIATWEGLIIGGHLMDIRGVPMVGVEVRLSGDGEGSDVTDVNGNYDLRRYDPGCYTITPTAPGWTFWPRSREITLTVVHRRSEDFVGRPLREHVAVKHGEPGLFSFDVLPPENGTVTLRIVSPRGRVVWRTDVSVEASRATTIDWSGRDRTGREAASGVYIAAISGAGCRTTQKIVVLR